MFTRRRFYLWVKNEEHPTEKIGLFDGARAHLLQTANGTRMDTARAQESIVRRSMNDSIVICVCIFIQKQMFYYSHPYKFSFVQKGSFSGSHPKSTRTQRLPQTPKVALLKASQNRYHLGSCTKNSTKNIYKTTLPLLLLSQTAKAHLQRVFKRGSLDFLKKFLLLLLEFLPSYLQSDSPFPESLQLNFPFTKGSKESSPFSALQLKKRDLDGSFFL